jgi:hypothetical protein
VIHGDSDVGDPRQCPRRSALGHDELLEFIVACRQQVVEARQHVTPFLL